MSEFKQERATVTVDTAALTENFRTLSAMKGASAPIAVVKANAYGHGTAEVVAALCAAGCRAFAVATIEEALAVRLLDRTAKILILGYTPPQHASLLSGLHLTQTVFSADYARALAAASSAPVSVHFKVNGGMNRLGFSLDAAGETEILRAAEAFPVLRPEGVFIHLPSVTEAPEETDDTLRRFARHTHVLRSALGDLVCHAAASTAILSRRDAFFGAMRPGLALYGILPDGISKKEAPPLNQVLHITAPVVQVREVPRGTRVGYGGTFVTARASVIGIVPVGYGDGIPVALTGYSLTLLHGGVRYAVPIVGRICMDYITVDLTGTPAEAGDSVLLFEDISAAAAHAGIIPYALVTGISARVPRCTI